MAVTKGPDETEDLGVTIGGTLFFKAPLAESQDDLQKFLQDQAEHEQEDWQRSEDQRELVLS
jgi:hypothetical protein